MKYSRFIACLYVGILCLSPLELIGQWQSDVRLTNDPGLSLTAYNNGRRIGTNGDVLHVVWADDGDRNLEIYYKRSTNGGVTWESDKRATSNTADSQHPSIGVSGSAVHIVWQDNRDGNFEIYYKRSTDGGNGWIQDTRLTNNPANSKYASLAVTGSVMHVVWQDDRDNYDEIYYKRSSDGGSSWGPDIPLTSSPFSCQFPSVAVSGSVVHVVWQDLRDAGWEIYYKRSTDGGANWGPDTRLTNSTGWALYPSITVLGTMVHVACQDDRSGTEEIYYKRSTDGGSTWGADTRLTNNAAWSLRPSVAVAGSGVHIVWHDYRDGNAEIYYKRSVDGGINWGQDTRLTSNPSYSENASVALSGSVVHVVWQDDRDGNYEIYYKRDPSGNPTGIRDIGAEVPKEFSLIQNYPNPFNPSTTISYSMPKPANVSLEIFNALGQQVGLLVNGQVEAGIHRVTWNASNVASGVYFCRFQARFVAGEQAGDALTGSTSTPQAGSAQGFVQTKAMILIR